MTETDRTDDPQGAFRQRTLAKVAWRLVPFLALLYVFNIL
jgi:hypothetical protein